MNNHDSNIPYLIKQLLKEGKSVYLPNIGELSPVIESAYFDKVSKKLYPPKYDYVFNEEGVVNDNLSKRLLVNKLATPSNVETIIEKYSSSLFNDILNSGSTIINGVGTLMTNGTGVIFKQDSSLTDVHLENLKPIFLKERSRDNSIKKKQKRSASTDWMPVIIGFLIGFLLLGAYFLFRGIMGVAALNTEKKDSIETQNVQKVNTELLQLDTLEKYSNKVDYKINQSTKTVTHNYVIMTGKLSQDKNVEEMITLIEKIDNQVISNDNQNLTRVGVLMSCEDVDVNNNLEEIKSRLSNDAWVLDSQS